ncbi:MAG: septum formation initiator family protein [Alphaproteobacteria bacterium]|nr:septum formation initiator family protein [Alphaproteobacteria bacterium]
MNKLLSHSAVLRENLVILIGLCLCVYFAYHTLQGNRSLYRYYTVNKKIEMLSQKNAALESEANALEKKIVMMRPGSVDKDLLEERVRFVLGYRDKNEYTILGN